MARFPATHAGHSTLDESDFEQIEAHERNQDIMAQSICCRCILCR